MWQMRISPSPESKRSAYRGDGAGSKGAGRDKGAPRKRTKKAEARSIGLAASPDPGTPHINNRILSVITVTCFWFLACA